MAARRIVSLPQVLVAVQFEVASVIIPSFKNNGTTKDAKRAKKDEVYLLHNFASFAHFVVTSFQSSELRKQ